MSIFSSKKTRQQLELAHKQLADQQHLIQALQNHNATISFHPDGRIIKANPLFLETMGYTEEAILDQHHRIFCTKEQTQSPEYLKF